MQRSSNNEEKRRVCFDSEIDVVPVDSVSDYSTKERSSAWYTSAECRVFKVQYIRENLESNPAARKMDFVRAQRIDAVRDLLLKAQDVQRKQSFRSTTSDVQDSNFDKKDERPRRNEIGIEKNRYSFTRWLADFYKHHSEACGIAARTRGMENSNTVNECWSCENNIEHKHHHRHRRQPQRSSADAATIASSQQFSQSKRFSITMGSRSFEDLATLAKDEEEIEILPFSNSEWKHDGRAGSLKGDTLSFSKRKDLAPNKPQRKSSDLARKFKTSCTICDGPSYNSRGKNEGGDLPSKPLRHVCTPPILSESVTMAAPKSQKRNKRRNNVNRVPIRQIGRNDSPPARAA